MPCLGQLGNKGFEFLDIEIVVFCGQKKQTLTGNAATIRRCGDAQVEYESELRGKSQGAASKKGVSKDGGEPTM